MWLKVVVSSVLLLGVTTASPVPSAGAQSAPSSAGRPAPSKDPAVLAADGRSPAGVIVATSPILDTVPVTSERYDGAAEQRDADAADLADANHRITVGEVQLVHLESDRTALVDLIGRTSERERKLRTAAAALAVTMRSIVINRFVNGSTDESYPDPNLTIEEQLDLSQRNTIAGEAEQEVERNAQSVAARLDAATSSLADWRHQQTDNENATADTTKGLTKARSDSEIATAAIVDAEAELRRARPTTIVVESDLPLVALDAYWRAANDLAVTRPACKIAWWALAGVGRTESRHGGSSGGMPEADGTVTVPIFGPPLDGTNGTRVIADTDKGELDLDPTMDRAVGVMQFLPGTWKRYAEDESGDKRADPQNIYDAALAAGKLLCSTSGDLDTDEGLRKAYFAYNHSESYVDTVLERAHAYQALPVPPSGNEAPDAAPN